MTMIAPGIWHWQGEHPEWKAGDDWPRTVSSYAVEDESRLLLFDPMPLTDELEGLASARETEIVLTSPWHERATQNLMERLGAPVWTPAPDPGTDDLAWLHRDGGGTVQSNRAVHLYGTDDGAPDGVMTFAGHVPNDIVLWVPAVRAVIVGDTLVDRGSGLEIPDAWLDPGVTHDDVVGRLSPLLELPIEHVLATHGGPLERASLERALAT